MMGHLLRSKSLRVLLFATIVGGLLITLAAGAAAQSGDADMLDEDRESEKEELEWMPSLAISWGAYSQSMDGTTTASESSITPSTGDSLITTMFQFEGKLHTPFQLDVPSKPRLFMTVGLQIPLADELIAERIDESFDRGEAGFPSNCPDTIPGPNPPPDPNEGLASTCSLAIRNRVSIDAMWYAGLGVDFTLPVLDDQFHIAPAVEYYGFAAQTVGEFKRSTSGLGLNDLVEVADVVGDAEVYHGISPSLTLSVDVFEEGPWRWSMFLQGRAVFVLNDPDTSARTTLGTNQIDFFTDLDDVIAQGTGGIQIQWTGRRSRR
jgi:hypothetical protein